jgi:secreted PhoX family phosphatase
MRDDITDVKEEKENIPSNKSGNRSFADVLKSNVSRRTILKGSLAAAATGFITPNALAHGKWSKNGHKWSKHKKHWHKNLVDFKPVSIETAAADASMPSISDDYYYEVLIPWGTPIEPRATEAYKGDPSYRPTAEQAEKQIGIGHDGMWFFPYDLKRNKFKRYGYKLSNRRGMLCINHEYGTNSHLLGKPAPETLEDVRLSQSAHGVSVVEIKQTRRGHWKNVRSANARRITVNTPVEFSGPVVGSGLLENTSENPTLGTVNNCGAGHTPWGTYLTCEENFNGYFGIAGVDGSTSSEDVAAITAEYFVKVAQDNELRAEMLSRYGFDGDGFDYNWHNFDKRFDLSDPDYANENHRFGWVVEIDPFDGTKKPVKRTALGRFKHEAIAIAEAPSGRIAAYMGDDQRFDYCYKYVSDYAWEDCIAHGVSPLDHGKLYVARFNDDGAGDWLELTIENQDLAAKFETQAEVLVNTRIAADILGATPMDRPEWTTIGKDGEVYWTLTNNSQRTEANAANPEAPNSDGHIIRTTGDHTGTTFQWEIYQIASTTRGTEAVFTDPDAAWADPFGRLFIGTDGGQPDGLQDQLVVFDTTAESPEPKRLFVGVASDEVTGFTITPDHRTAFINIQHPGNGSPETTSFPALPDGKTIPRDCTLVIRRKDGGIIGS